MSHAYVQSHCILKHAAALAKARFGLDKLGGICRGDARDFHRHWFPSSTPLIRNLPSQPGKTTFPVTGFDRSCRLINVPHCNSFRTY